MNKITLMTRRIMMPKTRKIVSMELVPVVLSGIGELTGIGTGCGCGFGVVIGTCGAAAICGLGPVGCEVFGFIYLVFHAQP